MSLRERLARLARLEEQTPPEAEPEIIIRFVNPDGSTASIFNPRTGW